ncbi:MAG: ABC transporter permease subunit [Proteobacteria bacterium]|nr:ABC transporter permease subunit [Pseudomonadota bacterium]
MKITPVTLKKIKRFQSIKRGYYSLIIIATFIILSLFAEVFINSRALIVKYNGSYYFPTYRAMIPGNVFDLGYDYETNYRALQKQFENDPSGNFVLMPLIPYNPFENDLREDTYPPFPPSLLEKHYLGTDTIGRDIAARLTYGFRIAIFFSLALLAITYGIGISLGCLMGYLGGRFDLFFQRIIEIWTNVPVLFVIIIISSIIVPNPVILLLIMAFFGWTSITWIMRTMTYKEKAREYILASKALGATDVRIIFKHIIPNTIAIIVTFAPFTIASGIVALTSLDYLGFGLPAPTPSWGDLLQQGWSNMDALWIAGSVIGALIVTLLTVTFVGEAVREAFDPKMYTIYE